MHSNCKISSRSGARDGGCNKASNSEDFFVAGAFVICAKEAEMSEADAACAGVKVALAAAAAAAAEEASLLLEDPFAAGATSGVSIILAKGSKILLAYS